MRELSLAQKAMLNGSVCPYCKVPSTMINTVEGKQVGCEKCGAWMRPDPFGKPMGRLARPDLLRSMDMVMTEINIFAYRTKRDVQDIYKSLSGELDIPIEHISPYKMSLPSLLNTMRYIEKYSDNHIRIGDYIPFYTKKMRNDMHLYENPYWVSPIPSTGCSKVRSPDSFTKQNVFDFTYPTNIF